MSSFFAYHGPLASIFTTIFLFFCRFLPYLNPFKFNYVFVWRVNNAAARLFFVQYKNDDQKIRHWQEGKKIVVWYVLRGVRAHKIKI